MLSEDDAKRELMAAHIGSQVRAKLEASTPAAEETESLKARVATIIKEAKEKYGETFTEDEVKKELQSQRALAQAVEKQCGLGNYRAPEETAAFKARVADLVKDAKDVFGITATEEEVREAMKDRHISRQLVYMSKTTATYHGGDKATTGFVGVPVVPNALQVLENMYDETLRQLANHPVQGYAQIVEDDTKEKLRHIKASKTVREFELNVAMQAEEAIEQAGAELQLIEWLKGRKPTELNAGAKN